MVADVRMAKDSQRELESQRERKGERGQGRERKGGRGGDSGREEATMNYNLNGMKAYMLCRLHICSPHNSIQITFYCNIKSVTASGNLSLD